jgi:hypothetical protein
VVDKSQEVFQKTNASGKILAIFQNNRSQSVPNTIKKILSMEKPENKCKVIFLYDFSQAQLRMSDIDIPAVERENMFTLNNVHRNSKRIALAATTFQMPNERSNATKCGHDSDGARIKTYLFDYKNDFQEYEEYASHVINAIQDVKEQLKDANGQCPSLHKRLVIVVPDQTFRLDLAKNKRFKDELKKLELSPITAFHAMQTTDNPGSHADGSNALIVVDEVSEMNGLEFLFLIVAGLDKAIRKSDASERKLV